MQAARVSRTEHTFPTPLPHSPAQGRGLPKRRGGSTVVGPHSPFLPCNSMAALGPLLKTKTSTGKAGVRG